MTVSQVTVQFITDLPDLVYQVEYFLLCFHPFCDLCALLRLNAFAVRF
jgi:hypothetical protein